MLAYERKDLELGAWLGLLLASLATLMLSVVSFSRVLTGKKSTGDFRKR